MTSSRLLRLLTVPAVALACLLALAPAVLAAGRFTYFTGATAGRHEYPKNLYLTADGTLEVQDIEWSDWGGATALGEGTAEYHGCTPNCASGTPHQAKVSVVLSHVVTCSGVRYYDHVALQRVNTGATIPTYSQHWAPCRQ